MSLFSETLVELRLGAGFKSAYKFFHDNGGDPVLKMSYSNYLMTERGATLPALSKLSVLFFALRLQPDSAGAGALVKAWFRTSYGDEPFTALLAPLMREPDEPAKSRSMGNHFDDLQITQEQLGTIASARLEFLCYLLLSNDEGAWSPGELALRAGEREAAVSGALQRLKLAGILSEPAPGKYKYRWAGAQPAFPRGVSALSTYDKIGLLENSLLGKAELAYILTTVGHIDQEHYANLQSMLSLCLDHTKLYSRTTGGARTALIAVEERVIKLDWPHTPPEPAGKKH